MRKKLSVLFIFVIFIFVSCSNLNEGDFKGSTSFPDFPVPVEADLVENKEGVYEKYLYNAKGTMVVSGKIYIKQLKIGDGKCANRWVAITCLKKTGSLLA
ncbi:MAG: hypothetical protein H0Z33_05860 [Bacillaceae bacterium]|nr:hypothetical protein [Bacillaceae bacterium]